VLKPAIFVHRGKASPKVAGGDGPEAALVAMFSKLMAGQRSWRGHLSPKLRKDVKGIVISGLEHWQPKQTPTVGSASSVQWRSSAAGPAQRVGRKSWQPPLMSTWSMCPVIIGATLMTCAWELVSWWVKIAWCFGE
jgi:hypothetical protein